MPQKGQEEKDINGGTIISESSNIVIVKGIKAEKGDVNIFVSPQKDPASASKRADEVKKDPDQDVAQEKMNALGLKPGIPGLQKLSIPKPCCGPDDVLIKTGWIGICGTDFALFEGGAKALPADAPPLVFFHEAIGEIVERGKNVPDEFEEGTWVTPLVRRCRMLFYDG
ncbi:MAG: alcohol dehydrogenase catalytic domain-containing protein, partial [Chloroflexi bacterium]|nr:alcohol dehydrogenase catalytic domain-containing protein [Chloroflexota bacterium]